MSVYQNPAGFSQGCNELKQLQTLSGNLILWQVEYTPVASSGVLCPDCEGNMDNLDPFALFMSKQVSVLSDIYVKNLMKIKPDTDESTKYLCLGVNTDLSHITNLILEE
jgi:hypothetical protein